MTTPIRKAVFPVAGLGTRFLPATKSIPKEMLPLIDRPLIQYAVDEARAAGIEEFLFITSPGKTALEGYFGHNAALDASLDRAGKTALRDRLRASDLGEGGYAFLRQDAPRGLGHAVSLARRFVGDEPFAVLLPDDVIDADTPALAQMVQAWRPGLGHMVATECVSDDRIGAYGVVDIARQTGPVQHLRGLVEKPAPAQAPSRFGIVGRYILHPSIFDRLAQQAPGSGGEVQLTDAIAADLSLAGCTGFAFDGERFDCGSVAGFVEATAAFALGRDDLRTGFAASLQARLAHPALAA